MLLAVFMSQGCGFSFEVPSKLPSICTIFQDYEDLFSFRRHMVAPIFQNLLFDIPVQQLLNDKLIDPSTSTTRSRNFHGLYVSTAETDPPTCPLREAQRNPRRSAAASQPQRHSPGTKTVACSTEFGGGGKANPRQPTARHRGRRCSLNAQ